MVVDMVSVVMEGVVVMNSFPTGALPSTCWPEEGLLEMGRASICHLGSHHSSHRVTGCVGEHALGGSSHTKPQRRHITPSNSTFFWWVGGKMKYNPRQSD